MRLIKIRKNENEVDKNKKNEKVENEVDKNKKNESKVPSKQVKNVSKDEKELAKYFGVSEIDPKLKQALTLLKL